MKRDSLATLIERKPFFAKVLQECRDCHSVGLKPGLLDTGLGDYGLRELLRKSYSELTLNGNGICPVCASLGP